MRKGVSSIPRETSTQLLRDKPTRCSLPWRITIAPCFDRVLAWTQANLAGSDLGTNLPAWLWGKDKDGQWKTLDPNSASDADVWMAYTLIEAGRLWNNPAYTRTGRSMLPLIAKNEVTSLPDFGPILIPGPLPPFSMTKSGPSIPATFPCLSLIAWASSILPAHGNRSLSGFPNWWNRVPGADLQWTGRTTRKRTVSILLRSTDSAPTIHRRLAGGKL